MRGEDLGPTVGLDVDRDSAPYHLVYLCYGLVYHDCFALIAEQRGLPHSACQLGCRYRLAKSEPRVHPPALSDVHDQVWLSGFDRLVQQNVKLLAVGGTACGAEKLRLYL